MLSLVPNVKHLALVLDTQVVQDKGVDVLCACFGILPSKARDLARLRKHGFLNSVKSLVIRGPAPAATTGLQFFPGIHCLHLRVEFRPNRRSGLATPVISRVHFRNISKLRLGKLLPPVRMPGNANKPWPDLQVVPKPSNMTRTTPSEYFGPLLAAFENLRHLDLSNEPWEHGHSSKNQLDLILQHVHDPSKLVTLILPRSTEYTHELIVAMSRFVNLVSLSTPFDVITDADMDVFENLPESLQHLIVHDSVIDTIPCVLDLFARKSKGESLAGIKRIDLWFDYSFDRKFLILLQKGIMFPCLQRVATKLGVHLTFGNLYQ